MRFYWPIAKIDAEQRMVWGYASTEALDDQGETVTREAMAAALDGYMRFANIREMHQNSAVGVAKEADVDDKGLYLGAKIVDDGAWRKVAEGVYKGFSIGGRVTARDPINRKMITGLALTEISVVDRPANPETVFDCWKVSAGGATESDGDAQAEPHQAVAAPGPLPRLLGDLEWLRQRVAADAAGAAARPALRRVQAIVAELCGFVAALVAGESSEQPNERPGPETAEIAALAIAATLRKAHQPDFAPAADAVAKLADQIIPRLDALQRRVEEIACTPLPPQTAGRGFAFAAISKREDGGGSPAAPDDIVAALARMTDEERTLILIKAARANPIAPFGAPFAGPFAGPAGKQSR